jgi:hypothetical protein
MHPGSVAVLMRASLVDDSLSFTTWHSSVSDVRKYKTVGDTRVMFKYAISFRDGAAEPHLFGTV